MDKLKIAQKYEWALHLFPLVFPYSTAVVGLIGGVYEEVDFGLGCWVSGRMNLLWVCIFLGFPFVVTVKIVAGCTLSVVLAAKTYLKQNAPKEPARLYPVDITKADPKKVQEDAMQCQLYSASCIFCISWMMALRMLDEGPAGDRSQEGSYYWLILMAHLSYPLKGFLDFFIFLRPAVIEKRRYDPSLTKIMALRAVLFLGSRQRDGSVDLSSQQSQGTKQQNSNVESFVHEVDGFDDSLDGFSAVSLASRSTATQRTRRGSQTPNNGQGKVNRFKRAFSDDHVVGDGDVHGPDWLE